MSLFSCVDMVDVSPDILITEFADTKKNYVCFQ